MTAQGVPRSWISDNSVRLCLTQRAGVAPGSSLAARVSGVIARAEAMPTIRSRSPMWLVRDLWPRVWPPTVVLPCLWSARGYLLGATDLRECLLHRRARSLRIKRLQVRVLPSARKVETVQRSCTDSVQDLWLAPVERTAAASRNGPD
jgi:hypothetical protein